MECHFPLILALALSAPAIRAAGDPGTCRVWARSDTVHVLRVEPAGTVRSVALAAARCEWRSFQILVRSDSRVHSSPRPRRERRPNRRTQPDIP